MDRLDIGCQADRSAKLYTYEAPDYGNDLLKTA
jgi:hypothetical protein